MSKLHTLLETIKKPVEKVGEKVKSPFHALEKEKKLGPVLHAEVLAALKQLQKKHPDMKKVLEKAAGYAVIPEIGRSSLVLGGAYGVGEVFEHERVVGYAAILELTIGVQVGGQTFHELVVFKDDNAIKQFKHGKLAFAADAAVEMVKAGAQASKGFGGNTQIFIFTDGGMLVDLAIGGQKFIYKHAAIGRTRTSEGVLDTSEEEEQKADEQAAAAQRKEGGDAESHDGERDQEHDEEHDQEAEEGDGHPKEEQQPGQHA